MLEASERVNRELGTTTVLITHNAEVAAFSKVSAQGVEEQRVLVIVDITAPPELWHRLGDGYRVEARFILW